MWVRLVLPIATMLTFVAPGGAQAGDGDVLQGDGESEPQIFEGTVAANCQWPMVVSIGNFSICTATLVHPRLITTAAHCLEGGAPSVARFGESFGAPVATVPIEFCVSHPDYPGSIDGGIPSNAIDAAFCVLEQEVGLPVAPIPQGCEMSEVFIGQDRIAVVGYGNDNPGVSDDPGDDTGAGIKRYDASRIDYWDPTDHTVRADGPCQGDSGGPIMLQLSDDSWRNLGMLSSGSGDCGTPVPSNYMQTPYFLDWLEDNSGIDLSPCYDDAGRWSPTEYCGNFAVDPLNSAVSWSDGCQLASTGPASTCGPSYVDAPDTTAPTVAIVSPASETPFDGSLASISIDVDVDDAWPIKEVRLFIDGEQVSVLSAPDYVVEADFPEGEYTITATAEDWSGNVGSSEAVSIGVGAAPEGGGADETGEDDGGDAADDAGAPEDDDGGGVQTGGDGGDTGGDEGGTDAGAGGSGSESGGCSVSGRSSIPAFAWVTLAFVTAAARRRRA